MPISLRSEAPTSASKSSPVRNVPMVNAEIIAGSGSGSASTTKAIARAA